MHRVAGAFLGGSAVLTLLPVIVGVCLVRVSDHLSTAYDRNVWLGLAYTMAGLIMVCPILLALYQFTRDLVCFYYAPRSPHPKVMQPRFALAAISLAPDEAPRARTAASHIQLSDMDFQESMIPLTHEDGVFLLEQYEDTHGDIVPESPGDARRKALAGQQFTSTEARHRAQQVMACMGLAGLEDRELVREAARMEFSLARHSFFLRRLVFRFAKAVLVTLWTAMMSFLLACSLPPALRHANPLWWAAPLGVLFLYAPMLIMAVRRPLKWVLFLWKGIKAPQQKVDAQLLKFEHIIIAFAVTVLLATIGFLAVWVLVLMPQTQ